MRRVMQVAVLLAAFEAIPHFCFCQSASNVSSATASSATQLLAQTVTAMSQGLSAGSISDFALTGSMQIGDSSPSNPTKVLSRGRDMKLEIAMQGGQIHSVVFLKGRGSMRDEFGKKTTLSSSSRAGAEIAFLPMPVVLQRFVESPGNAKVEADETIGGRLVHHVILSLQYSHNEDPSGIMSARSRTEFFIDSQTFLILRMRQIVYDARGQRNSQREVAFSDYRPVDGLILPFLITELSDGQKSWALTVESIELNPKLTDGDFQL